MDRTRTLRGALAGTVAAGVWLLQQPLDKRIFGCRYDDAELLGRLTGTAPSARRGAAPGQRRGVRRDLLRGRPAPAGSGDAARPGRRPGRAPRHLAAHAVAPARAGADPPARARSRSRPGATCCSASCSGELERRLNPEPLEPVSDEAVASNGHGSAAHLVASDPR